LIRGRGFALTEIPKPIPQKPGKGLDFDYRGSQMITLEALRFLVMP